MSTQKYKGYRFEIHNKPKLIKTIKLKIHKNNTLNILLE